MENTHIIERLVSVEEGRKSNTKRIDEHDEQIKELQNTYKIMEKMDYRMGKVETAVDNIDKKLDEKTSEQSKEKGKKWDKLIDYIFYFILALLLGYIAKQLGIN